MKLILLRVCLVIFLVPMIFSGAQCSGVLSPRWDPVHRLPLKSLEVKVTVEGSVAKTSCFYEFENDTGRQLEARFYFRLPQQGVVTEFAYYFAGKRVKAYIVEDSRANFIYETITSAGRDPALLKKVQDNTFMAQIFPVEPEGVKIELTYFHPLPFVQSKGNYNLDLTGKFSVHEIGSFKFSGTFLSPYPIKNITCNYPHELSSHNKGVKLLKAQSDNLSPKKPFNVLIEPEAAGMQTYLYAAPSGGREGFFALTLVPQRTVNNPRIRIYGIKTYDIYPRRLPAKLNSGEAVSITGRYLPGKAIIFLEGYSEGRHLSFRADKTFSAESIPNNSASKLWADPHLEDLGNRAKELKDSNLVDETIRLSKRFGVMSPFTSFLAVPESELEAFYESLKNEIAEFSYKMDQIYLDKTSSKPQKVPEQIALRVKSARGDPLITVEAPEDALSVNAVFPDGRIRPLQYDYRNNKWRIRFNIPFSADEGEYKVLVIVHLKDGSVQQAEFSYNVSGKPPRGSIKSLSYTYDSIHLKVQGDSAVARVAVTAPWGQEELSLSSWEGVFSRRITIPEEYRGTEFSLQVILMDKAHNRTVISISPLEEEK